MNTTSQDIASQRAEAFREFHAEQLRKQTKSLDTIRSLMILWFVIALAVGVIQLVGAMAG